MMKSQDTGINQDVFDHLVDLAAFKLTEEEKGYLHEQMNHQLNVIRELEAIPLPKEIPVTTHGVEYGEDGKPALRKDGWEICENAKEILKQAPEVEDGYIVVPDIPTMELKE